MVMADEIYPAGHNTYVLDATDLPTGIYLYAMETGSFHELRKLVLIK